MFGQGFHFKTPISPRKATYLQSEQILLKQGRTRCQWCIYCSGWNNNSSEAAVKAQQWSLKPRMKPLGHLMLLGVSDPIWSLKELPVWRLSMISHFEVVLHASVVGIGEGPCLEEGLYQWTHFCFIQTVNFSDKCQFVGLKWRILNTGSQCSIREQIQQKDVKVFSTTCNFATKERSSCSMNEISYSRDLHAQVSKWRFVLRAELWATCCCSDVHVSRTTLCSRLVCFWCWKLGVLPQSRALSHLLLSFNISRKTPPGSTDHHVSSTRGQWWLKSSVANFGKWHAVQTSSDHSTKICWEHGVGRWQACWILLFN